MRAEGALQGLEGVGQMKSKAEHLGHWSLAIQGVAQVTGKPGGWRRRWWWSGEEQGQGWGRGGHQVGEQEVGRRAVM